MARFPNRESEIVELADSLTAGLAANSQLYPDPPVPAEMLGQSLGRFQQLRDDLNQAAAAYQAALSAKNQSLKELVKQMKSDIRYAENTAGGHSEKLKVLGWDCPKTRVAMAAPGQCGLLKVTRQGDSWLKLSWKKPADGGKVAAYIVMRRDRIDGSFAEVATAMETSITLTAQPRGIEMEYQVTAINKAGTGIPGNTEMVVL